MNPQFARTVQLLGEDRLMRLQNASVTVCGLGAVGSFAVEALARSGIGHLRLVDFDTVDVSNINRQVYALHSTVGLAKADLAADRIRDIHPECTVEVCKTFIDDTTLPALLENEPDAVIDAIDGVSSKVHLIREAVSRNRFIVSSMGAAARYDAGRIEVADLAKTHHCPLARIVRNRLGRVGISSGVTCVFSAEPAENRNPPVVETETAATRGRTRPPIGSLAHVTGSFGLRIAGVVIDHLMADQAPGEVL